MKILYYTSDYFPIVSGTSIQLRNTIINLPENISCSGIITPQVNAKSAGKEKIIPLPYLKLPFISKDQCYSAASLGSFFKLYNIVRKNKPDALHVIINIHIDPGIYYLIIICKLLRVKLLFSYHTHLERYFPYMFKKNMALLSKILLRLSLRFLYFCYNKPVLVPSQYMQEYFYSIGLKKTGIWEFCIDKNIFSGQARNYFVYDNDKTLKRLIFAGRLEAEKNINKLIELFLLLRESDPSFILTICGRGTLAKDIKNIHGINCLGEIENEKLPQIYNKHDIFVTCSDTETFGNTTVEAMACGLIVVAANACGTKDIIKNDHNGFLFEPNDLEAAKEMIINIFADSDKRKEILLNTFSSVKKYSAENSVKLLVDFYRKHVNS
jgi:glycosyltransferase involved in cell wall biosynthesis